MWLSHRFVSSISRMEEKVGAENRGGLAKENNVEAWCNSEGVKH